MLNSCYNCNHRNNSLYKEVGNYSLVQCRDCSLVYLEEYPENLFDFIDNAKSEKTDDVEFWSVPDFIEKYKSIFDKYYEQRLERLRKFNYRDNSHVLDVGIGYGDWANKMVASGATVEGIDVSNKVVKYCVEKYNLKATLESFEDYDISGKKFDLITMFDVLEHFKSPDLALKKAHEALSENGMIYIQVPNVLGFKIPLNHGYGLPYHLWQFNKFQLFKILEKNGFEVLDYWTGIQGIIGYHDRGENHLLNRAIWSLANFFKVGNRIQVLARKI
ncbi:bifunctional 2-polyprenyl-6-hydroxyphenol methylase/3-demethylubiquinol 3-O-methyltransferase UbiG [Halobacteriovorax sp. HLS]|uniref:class I SAM-dependent methyltransferase n=1 Tax=Halobacteriovorax sp. HLS TaxID=2234000 RepID=UPI0013E3C27A|nr:class I SAM-dependent methyltransferase [Halobacteriovorax sp. HLS]